MNEYINKEKTIDALKAYFSDEKRTETEYGAYWHHVHVIDCIDSMKSEDVVPWEVLERYADWFCALVPYPEFIREAKAFYKSTINAMEGGNISDG